MILYHLTWYVQYTYSVKKKFVHDTFRIKYKSRGTKEQSCLSQNSLRAAAVKLKNKNQKLLLPFEPALLEAVSRLESSRLHFLPRLCSTHRACGGVEAVRRGAVLGLAHAFNRRRERRGAVRDQKSKTALLTSSHPLLLLSIPPVSYFLLGYPLLILCGGVDQRRRRRQR